MQYSQCEKKTNTHSLPNEKRHIAHDRAQQQGQCDSMGHEY